jgi:hypothetical protein
MEVWGGNRAVDSGVVMAGLDAWVYSRPFHGAAEGGDVHYVSSCATGRINRLLLADVSGHGADVGRIGAALRGLMRRYVNYVDPCRFVGEMNRRFAVLAPAGQFATAVVTTFYAPTNELTVCNAGHPTPLLYRAARRQWTPLTERDAADEATAPEAGVRNIPLGIDDAVRYEPFTVRLKVGDLVLCFTDSLTESRGPDRAPLGERGLLNVVRGLGAAAAADPSALVPALLAAVEALCAGNLAGDDVTVLLFRPNGLGRGVPLWDKLLAPWRVLRAAAAAAMAREPLPLPELSVAHLGGAVRARLGRRRRDAGREGAA